MATREEAIHRVVEAGFSARCAELIVDDLGPQSVFNGMRERENSGTAAKFVEAHGYDKPSAAAIVEKSGAHIINTAAMLSSHKPEEQKHSLWDFPADKKARPAAAAGDKDK
jgi:hypothetical protein